MVAETRLHLHGPKLARWLQKNGVLREHLDPMGKWIEGRNPSVWTVDKYLTPIGFHIREIPGYIWLKDDPRVTAIIQSQEIKHASANR